MINLKAELQRNAGGTDRTDWISLVEFAQQLNRSSMTIRNWVDEGLITPACIDNTGIYFYPYQLVEALIRKYLTVSKNFVLEFIDPKNSESEDFLNKTVLDIIDTYEYKDILEFRSIESFYIYEYLEAIKTIQGRTLIPEYEICAFLTSFVKELKKKINDVVIYNLTSENINKAYGVDEVAIAVIQKNVPADMFYKERTQRNIEQKIEGVIRKYYLGSIDIDIEKIYRAKRSVKVSEDGDSIDAVVENYLMPLLKEENNNTDEFYKNMRINKRGGLKNIIQDNIIRNFNTENHNELFVFKITSGKAFNKKLFSCIDNNMFSCVFVDSLDDVDILTKSLLLVKLYKKELKLYGRNIL